MCHCFLGPSKVLQCCFEWQPLDRGWHHIQCVLPSQASYLKIQQLLTSQLAINQWPCRECLRAATSWKKIIYCPRNLRDSTHFWLLLWIPFSMLNCFLTPILWQNLATYIFSYPSHSCITQFLHLLYQNMNEAWPEPMTKSVRQCLRRDKLTWQGFASHKVIFIGQVKRVLDMHDPHSAK